MSRLSLSARAGLAMDALLLEQERKLADPDFGIHGIGLTDSDVLDVIDAWATGTCTETACTVAGDCCDRAALDRLVWALFEAATREP